MLQSQSKHPRRFGPGSLYPNPTREIAILGGFRLNNRATALDRKASVALDPVSLNPGKPPVTNRLRGEFEKWEHSWLVDETLYGRLRVLSLCSVVSTILTLFAEPSGNRDSQAPS